MRDAIPQEDYSFCVKHFYKSVNLRIIRLPVVLSVLVKRCFYSSNEVLMFRLRLAWGAAGGVIASVAKPKRRQGKQWQGPVN